MSYGYGGYPPQGQYDQFGHMSHSGPAYGGGYDAPPPPPPPQMYGYHAPYPPYMAPPPPPPMPHMHMPQGLEDFRPPPEVAYDPAAFRRFFSHQLEMLRFNSKPAITNMTLFANEHRARMASLVANCLEDHLKNCPPEHKLPALYLLDSISKNIGPPYVALFARFIERVFLQAYRSVDGPTQVKLEELLGTWRTGSSDGGELFRLPEEGSRGRVQRGIEDALFGPKHSASGSASADHAQAEAFATPGERSGVLFDIRRLLQRREDEVAQGSMDDVVKEQISALHKLENLVVGTQLTSDQVKQIRLQLAALAPPAPSEPPVEMPAPAPPPPESAMISGIDMGLLASLQASGGLSNLLATAQQMHSARQSASPAPPMSKVAAVALNRDPSAEEYDKAVLSINVKMANADFNKWQDHWTSFLYERLPLQCKQCGLRFFDSVRGKQFLDEHLDYHFTHKRRVREGAGRAQGRSWLALEEDWITAEDDTLNDALAPGSNGAAKAAQAVKLDRAELRKRKVAAPTDTAKLAKPCPICKEKFKAEWSEADEEWVFYNCVDVGGTLYHALCHAEAVASKHSAAQSREGTPGAVGSPGGGKKRAADNEDVKPELLMKRVKSEYS
ncbi:mRNA 3' end processing factor [Microbotryomycetes sp. JL201]|nr:mRNA 3' end processing factor [Microbotryomycetes sp. JL201]